MKKIQFDPNLILSPFKSMIVNNERIFLFIIEPFKFQLFSKKSTINTSVGYKHVHMSMDSFLLKMGNLGLKSFKPEMIESVLKVSFSGIQVESSVSFYQDERSIGYGVIIPLDIEYVSETKTGERCAGDEFDGEFSYKYEEMKFPAINSKNQIKEFSFPIDHCYYDVHEHNRIMEKQKFLFYATLDFCKGLQN